MSTIKTIIKRLNNQDVRFIPNYFNTNKKINHGKYITNEIFDNNDIIKYASNINERLNKYSINKTLEKLKYAMVQCSNNPLSEKAKVLIFSDSLQDSNLVVLFNYNSLDNNLLIEYDINKEI
jgi:hypothetical protein